MQNRKRSRRPTPWLHPNTNYLDNTIVKAFEQIGGGPAKRSRFKQGEVGEQHGGSGMRSLSVSSAIWSEGQRMAIDDELVKSAKEGKTRTVYVANGYDSTPYTFRFGSLASQLLPHARFFHLNTVTQRWHLVKLEEYKRITGRGHPTVGVLELLAQQAFVHFGGVSHSILVQPSIIPNQTASAIFPASEQGIPLLSSMRLTELCGMIKYMLLTEAPDGCPANLRKTCATSARLPENCFCFTP